MEVISAAQLFSLTALLQIGTTIIFGFAATAGRDAWISMLISMILGSLIVMIQLQLYRLNPGLTLVQWYPVAFGRWLGTPIAWLYPLLFIYSAGRMVRDLVDFVPTTLLPDTPPLAILVSFMLLIGYGLLQGSEVLGRVAEVIFGLLIVLYIAEIIGLLGSRVMDARELLPVMGDGWGRVWGAVWPTGLTQTFGETLLFSLIWPLVKEQDRIARATMGATILSGIVLIVADLLAIVVLGEEGFQSTIYPLYQVTRFIRMGDFLTNLDAIGVLFFSLYAFGKMSCYMFFAIRSIQQLTYMSSSRPLVWPVSLITLYVGMTMADNYMEHIAGVHMKILSPYLWVPLLFVMPGLLLCTCLVRRHLAPKATGGQAERGRGLDG